MLNGKLYTRTVESLAYERAIVADAVNRHGISMGAWELLRAWRNEVSTVLDWVVQEEHDAYAEDARDFLAGFTISGCGGGPNPAICPWPNKMCPGSDCLNYETCGDEDKKVIVDKVTFCLFKGEQCRGVNCTIHDICAAPERLPF